MSRLFITVETQLEIPSIPNFVRTQTGESIPIRELTDAQIETIGKAWAEEFLKKAQRARDADRRPPSAGALEVVR
jgi:hypothetical protein